MRKLLYLVLIVLVVLTLAGCNTGNAPGATPYNTGNMKNINNYLTTHYPNDVYPYNVNPTTNYNGWVGTGTGNNSGIDETGAS